MLFEANVMGGAHAGRPSNERETTLDGLNSSIRLGNIRLSLRHLKPIGRVVLRGLEPLYAAVIASDSADPPSKHI